MTQMELARRDIMTDTMERVAAKEGVDPGVIMASLAEGSVVIPANINHKHLDPVGIGKGLSIKVNANLGTSRDHADIHEELLKLSAAKDANVDAVMGAYPTFEELAQASKEDLVELGVAKSYAKKLITWAEEQ